MEKIDKPAKIDILARLAEIETWASKEKRLKEQTGMSITAFCGKYDLNRATYSRNRNLKTWPPKRIVEKVRICFEKEGIV